MHSIVKVKNKKMQKGQPHRGTALFAFFTNYCCLTLVVKQGASWDNEVLGDSGYRTYI
jgi:hypothetical protein